MIAKMRKSNKISRKINAPDKGVLKKVSLSKKKVVQKRSSKSLTPNKGVLQKVSLSNKSFKK